MIASLKVYTQSLIRNLAVTRNFSLSSTRNLIQKWRQERGLPLNPNACGVLTDGQDYSFVDGRPTPYGVGQMQRISKQRQLAEDIIRLTGEVDFAVERHRQIKEKEANKRRKILMSKLKPKGAALLKKIQNEKLP